jgi:hypothetical protein
LTKRMVLALVVVISHITLELLGGGSSGTSRFFYSDLGLIARVNTVNLSVVGVRVAYGGVGLLGIASTGDDGSGTFTELTLGDVELRGSGGGGRAVNSVEVSVVGWVLNLDFWVWRGRRRLGLVAVVGTSKLYTVRTLGVLDVLGVLKVLRVLWRRLGRSLSALLGWLCVASVLVDMNLFTVLRRLLRRLLSVDVLASSRVEVLLRRLLRRLGTAESLLFVDADLFLDVGVLVVVLRSRRRRRRRRRWRRGRGGGWRWWWVWVPMNGSGEGFVDFFVTFPSVWSLVLKMCFLFYLNRGRFLNFRVPIRRREDTEGDRNSCFKIQFAGVGSLLLENPSNRSKTIRKESRKNFLAPLRVSLGDFCGGRFYSGGASFVVLTCSNVKVRNWMQ